MPETNQPGAKPAPQAVQQATQSNQQSDAARTAGLVAAKQERRDKFFLAIATAILSRQTRSATDLARQCVEFTDVFIAALDARAN